LQFKKKTYFLYSSFWLGLWLLHFKDDFVELFGWSRFLAFGFKDDL
jgi:hypothetical protein